MKHHCKGSMTVFFSILTVLFISLLCALAESARVQGSRARASSLLDLGVFSLFGEYDRNLLEEYDVFAFNASYGLGEFSMANVEERLDGYLEANLSGKTLFPMDTEGSAVTEYALLTDGKGEVFKNQVVANLKSALGTEAVSRFLERKQDAKELEEEGKNYEEQERNNEADLDRIEEEKKQAAEAETEGGDGVVEISPKPEQPTPPNPLDVIKRIKETGILGLVMKNPQEVSQKSLERDQLPSKRRRETGTMELPDSQEGVLADAVFLEYLSSRFGNFREPKEEGGLSYQMEYLVGGKTSDQENLKKVVNKLLLVREGVNFLCIGGSAGMRRQAELLAAALTGAVPIPGITAATTAALILAWAYGESLLDVRQLLSGGKVPLVKTEQSFKLSLDNLANLTEVLKECDNGGGEGVDYQGYLQILLVGGKQSEYPLRALDMIEAELRRKENYGGFCIDHCVVGMRAEADWTFFSVFGGIPSAFLGSSLGEVSHLTETGFFYQTS